MLPDALLEKLNLQGASVTSLQSLVNETFRIEKGSDKLIIKERREIRSSDYSPYGEMYWLAALAKQNFSAVRPYREMWKDNVFNIDGKFFSTYQYVEGAEPENTAESYFDAGKLLRQLHFTAQKIEVTREEEDLSRPVYNRQHVIDRFLPVISASGLYDGKQKEILLKLAERISVHFPEGSQFIHADYHLGNLRKGSDLTVLDFDEAGFGSVYYDLGTLKLHMFAYGNDELWHAFLDGYGIAHDDENLFYGAAARIFYSIGKLSESGNLPKPEDMNVANIQEQNMNIITRYTGYIQKLLNAWEIKRGSFKNQNQGNGCLSPWQ